VRCRLAPGALEQLGSAFNAAARSAAFTLAVVACAPSDEGFDNLIATVPCCGGQSSLNDLEYEWPCGFARFELALWNPGRGWLTEQELSAIAQALGHPVRQILAHI
jgi:hypothetical protein